MSNTSEIFEYVSNALEGKRKNVLRKKFKGSVVFHIEGTDEKWSVDLKCADPFCKKGDEGLPNPDLVVYVSEDVLKKLMNKTLNPQQAFMKGLLKVKGKMSLAMKLPIIIAASQQEAAIKSKL